MLCEGAQSGGADARNINIPGPKPVCVEDGVFIFQLQEAQSFKVHVEHHLQQNKYLGMSCFTQQKCF